METKLKFKVGDKVRVKSLEWYNENKNEDDLVTIDNTTGIHFNRRMSDFCGVILHIIAVEEDHYVMSGLVFYWQDWMLEDEPVTEEKQEEKQEEKRNKIVKASLQPITKEEAKKLLIGTKFFCTDYAGTDRLQKKLFECGCEWSDIGKKINIERWAIFVNAGGILTHENKEVVVWCEDSNIPILIDDVLAIKIKEKEKPKFDPKTLKPLDPVLVRMNINAKWVLRHFEYYENGCYDTTSSSFWTYCIPYNDETKHLHRTTNEAPEFYGCDDF